MFQNLLVVVGAGALPELQMSAACHSLAAECGAVLLEEGSSLAPHELLRELAANASDSTALTLLRLSGDVGVDESGEGSWMEALAAWRIPVLMLAQPRPDGRYGGIVPAFVALADSSTFPAWDLCNWAANGMPPHAAMMVFPGVDACKAPMMTQEG